MFDSDASSSASSRIGPNAILQLEVPVEATLGKGAMDRLLGAAQVSRPSGEGMIDEGDVARVHQILRQMYPSDAPRIARAAGMRTAAYIARRRIPAAARAALRRLPDRIGARLLSGAIVNHAWTFCGSGRLHLQRGRTHRFVLHDNPIWSGFRASAPLCDWHRAVFEELYSELLQYPYRVTETTCCAMGAPACTFEVVRG